MKTILAVIGGSVSYGLQTEKSDCDIRGLFVHDLRTYVSGQDPRKTIEFKNEHELRGKIPKKFEPYAQNGFEGQLYDLRPALQLLAGGNPNMLDLLFCDDEFVIEADDFAQKLRTTHKNLFVSAQLRHSFAGYAHSQLQRMQSHRSFILNPPSRPTREDFGLPQERVLSAHQFNTIADRVRKQLEVWNLDLSDVPETTALEIRTKLSEVIGHRFSLENMNLAVQELNLDSDVVRAFQKENAFEQANKRFGQFLEWQQHRNPERFMTEMQVGYDTKNAIHLIRLLHTCHVFFLTGELKTQHETITKLAVRIRACELSYDEIISLSEHYKNEIETMHKNKSYHASIPKGVDRERISELFVQYILPS